MNLRFFIFTRRNLHAGLTEKLEDLQIKLQSSSENSKVEYHKKNSRELCSSLLSPRYYWSLFKVTVMQIKKPLTNGRLPVSKAS